MVPWEFAANLSKGEQTRMLMLGMGTEIRRVKLCSRAALVGVWQFFAQNQPDEEAVTELGLTQCPGLRLGVYA